MRRAAVIRDKWNTKVFTQKQGKYCFTLAQLLEQTIVHVLPFLKQYGKNYPIYSDSLTAIKWVRMKKANSGLRRYKATERVWQLIERAEKWLINNEFRNPILKWETDRWGEIKADFGRK
jgi:ribonuclease HI